MSEDPATPYIISDCHAVGDMAPICDCSAPSKPGSYRHPGHAFAKDGTAAVAEAINGGTDVNCGCYYQKYLSYALGNGT